MSAASLTDAPAARQRAVSAHLEVPVDALDVHVYRIPTDAPEADGTLSWSSTTMVLVLASGGGTTGLGYSYTDAGAAHLIRDLLSPVVVGREALNVPAAWQAMAVATRNLGRTGIVASAMAAVDTALWDLKAHLLEVPLVSLFGAARDGVEVYGSGGFTSYADERLAEQLGGWARDGLKRVKMKVGSDPSDDPRRVRVAREAVGADVALMVDANGAYQRKQALLLAAAFADQGVDWFEEPVSSDDLAGLRLIRDQGPPGMAIAAGEYGYALPYFRRMLEAEAVDVLQADATRCAGFTGFLHVAALCEARSLPLSSHCAPALHLHVDCAAPNVVHAEWFHDHVRIERMLFDGVQRPVDGVLRPDRSLPGIGLELREADAAQWEVAA
jgi:L-alanine-DL-glutamate epimerase-like enolase superfamily enzyme